jgi:hypothetical protein
VWCVHMRIDAAISGTAARRPGPHTNTYFLYIQARTNRPYMHGRRHAQTHRHTRHKSKQARFGVCVYVCVCARSVSRKAGGTAGIN